MSYFQQKDERVYMFPETSTYLTPLNGTIVTANPVTYPWYSRLNIVPDGLDWDMPIKIKEKVWDIGSGKHPSHIINTIQEPVDITLEMMMVDARLLAMAIGTTNSAGSQAAVHTITPSTWTAINVDGAYFLYYVVDGSGHQKCYAIYSDVNSDQGGAPSITGTTNVNIDFASADNLTGVNITTVATYLDELELAMEALTEITVVTTTDTVATITTVANTGAVCHPRNGASSPAFTFTATTYGASIQTVTESTGSALPSFGIHIEYYHASEPIAVDLFGCTVISHETTVDFSEKIVKESVVIRASTYAIGNVSTCPPPKRTITPHIWKNLAESASNYLIMLGTTDKTPKIMSKMMLKVENEVDFHPEIGYAYTKHVIAGKRTVTMNLIGFIQINDLWTYWYDTWDNANGYYTNAAARLNSEIKIERTATYDTWQLSVYNWLIESYGLRIFPIDDKIMGIDVTFTDATPDGSGYIIDSFVISDYVAKIFYNVANA